MHDYLAAGDPSSLAGAPLVDIPYPEASRLRELLDTPEIRAALPPELRSRDTPSNWVETFKRTFLAQGYTWLGAGVLVLIALIARRALAAVGSTVGGLWGGEATQDSRKAG